eukprot:COSAG05_NODE_18041_length_315_cov_0.560185_1_plen_43_part_10
MRKAAEKLETFASGRATIGVLRSVSRKDSEYSDMTATERSQPP